MDIKKNECEKQQEAGGSSNSVTVQSILERGAEFYGQAEQALNDIYDKTTHTASEAYEKASSYSCKNPGKTILISLGVGVGLGLLLSLSFSHSRAAADCSNCG
ncbi:MAG: hypothetical protein NT010_11875 [Proteobacteria bacterium]|nr:hypothetical protein [Pseudomonadota bacterium]